jgi:WXG100 family type VII secretion target
MTNGGVLGVSPAELQRVSSSLSSLADELAMELKSVDEEVSGFVGTGWTGQSSDAYAQSFWKWFEGAKDVYAGLTEMALLLGTAGGQYDGQDQKSAAVLGTQMHING